MKWNEIFKNGPSKICGRQPLKNFEVMWSVILLHVLTKIQITTFMLVFIPVLKVLVGIIFLRNIKCYNCRKLQVLSLNVILYLSPLITYLLKPRKKYMFGVTCSKNQGRQVEFFLNFFLTLLFFYTKSLWNTEQKIYSNLNTLKSLTEKLNHSDQIKLYRRCKILTFQQVNIKSCCT